jgi:hypothetical protein
MTSPNDSNSPLLGYNTNVKHAGELFHIQTEDSGRERPHIITHLFTTGTILATKKTPYGELLAAEDWEDKVRQLMKDQHKAMFVELRDGVHDDIASQILGKPVGGPAAEQLQVASEAEPEEPSQVVVIEPAQMTTSPQEIVIDADGPKGRSIFETPDTDGQFGESLISDKSLDEVILDYLKDDLD